MMRKRRKGTLRDLESFLGRRESELAPPNLAPPVLPPKPQFGLLTRSASPLAWHVEWLPYEDACLHFTQLEKAGWEVYLISCLLAPKLQGLEETRKEGLSD